MTWLLGDASSYVSGQNIEVHGGMMPLLLGMLAHPGTTPLSLNAGTAAGLRT